MTNDEALRKYLGIGFEDLDAQKVTQCLVDAFVYHEGMADLSLNTINNKSASPASTGILWDAFETNNALAYAMRDILLKGSEKE
jgi:hypothetical protein